MSPAPNPEQTSSDQSGEIQLEPPALPPRPDWLSAYCDWAGNPEIPGSFTTWSGLALLASSVEHRVWCFADRQKPIYPNMYICLTAHPGIGKTEAISLARDILIKLPDTVVAPSSFSGSAFLESLADAKKRNPECPDEEYNTLAVFSSEMKNLTRDYDTDIIGYLEQAYDGKEISDKIIRGKREINIKASCVNIITATQPDTLRRSFPMEKWGTGLISRTLFIYCAEQPMRDVQFGVEPEHDGKPPRALIDDLIRISELYGSFSVEPAAGKAMNAWVREYRNPDFFPPRTRQFLGRSRAHLLKLCMALSLSRTDDLVISAPDVERATAILSETISKFHELWHILDTKVLAENTVIASLRMRLASGNNLIPQRTLQRLIVNNLRGYDSARYMQQLTDCGILQFVTTEKGQQPQYRITEHVNDTD